METLDRLAVDAETLGKPLLGRLRGLWSARVGAYRVLYSLDDGAVIVRASRHRAVAYGVRGRLTTHRAQSLRGQGAGPSGH